jgi:hypothetical protein
MARSLYRSVTYGLDASLALAQTVARAGGHTDADTLASALSYSGVRNGAFLSRLANARLFGLVAGRSGQVTLTERGRRCLSADPSVHRVALAEACWAVPLFRRVLQDASGAGLGDVDGLAGVLETRFGEDPSKARTTARVLLESAGRAGLLRAGRVDLSLVSDPITNFTDSDSASGRVFAPSVRFSWNPRARRVQRHGRPRVDKGSASMEDGTSAHGTGQPPDESDLWIDEGSGVPRKGARRRRVGIVVGTAACVALIGVPVGLLVASGPQPAPPRVAQQTQHHVVVSGGVAKRSVLAALSATTDSGNFAFSYQLDESPVQNSADQSNTSFTPACNGPVCPMASVPQATEVQGSGIINTNPMAMAASAAISTNGVSGLQVGVRVDPTTVWEVGVADNGLTPESIDSGTGGSPLAGFAGLVEGTLGSREGPVAMMGMASPTGYLDLVQPAVTSATEAGTATVDGVAVTQYQLTIDAGSLATAPGTSSEEQSAINAAIEALTAQGYRTIRDLVSVDASGFIRESASTVTFSDGGTVTLDAHFSNFGCAGTVLMPGQVGASSPPAGCVSADTGTAPTTPTTTTTGPNPQTPATVPPATPVSPSTTSVPSTTTTVSTSESTSSTTTTTSTTSRTGPVSATTG